MNGTDKEIRTQTSSSLPYNNNRHLIREPSSETMDHHGSDPADRFGGSGASVTPISVGSRLLNSPQPLAILRYRECLKNHAASNGGNITDGCGEFMPSGDDGTLEALKCAACNCHRNFHRKVTATIPIGPFLALPPPSPSPSSFNHHLNWPSSINTPRGAGSTYSSSHPMKINTMGESGGIGTESSSEELHFIAAGGGGMAPAYGMSNKKRFRSKFTQDQKDKMLEFAEKVGWRIPREDDPQVQSFCSQVGVKRQVLKVWMHNNKAVSAGKKLQVQDSIETTID